MAGDAPAAQTGWNQAGEPVRTLHIIPIVHSLIDLGNLAPRVLATKQQLLPGFDPAATAKSVRDFWCGLRIAIEQWDIDHSKVLLFQDALPSAPVEQPGMENMIVQSLADQGSQNHQILRWLMEQGAKLVGTESIELLLKEYHLSMALLEDSPDANAEDDGSSPRSQESRELLIERDQFIAARIDATLDMASIGVVFLGLMHSLEPWLAKDIQTYYPFGRPKGIAVHQV